MNESEQQRILRMVADGTISAEDARKLLASLSPKSSSSESLPVEIVSNASSDSKPKEKTVEVQMQRPDGSVYTVQLPPNLVSMFWEVAKVTIKESARNAAQETVAGLKVIAKNKSSELKAAIQQKMSGNGVDSPNSVPTSSATARGEARRQVLQMVSNGRINVEDAGRLIEQIDVIEVQNSKVELSSAQK